MIRKISYLEHENARLRAENERLRDENERHVSLLSQNAMLDCWDYADLNKEAEENKRLADQSIYYLSDLSTPPDCDLIREILPS